MTTNNAPADLPHRMTNNNRAPARLTIDSRYTVVFDDGMILLTAQRPDGQWQMFDPLTGKWDVDASDAFATAGDCYFALLTAVEKCEGVEDDACSSG